MLSGLRRWLPFLRKPRTLWRHLRRNRTTYWRRTKWFGGGLLAIHFGLDITRHGGWAWGRLWIAPWTGWAPVGMGWVLMGYAVAAPSRSIDWEDRGLRMCVHCDHPFNPDQAEDGYCPLCGAPTEALDGYYKRHPERNDPDPDAPERKRRQREEQKYSRKAHRRLLLTCGSAVLLTLGLNFAYDGTTFAGWTSPFAWAGLGSMTLGVCFLLAALGAPPFRRR